MGANDDASACGGGRGRAGTPVAVKANRRHAPRHPMALPVDVAGTGPGLTRDVSASGVYFECGGGLEAGSPIQFDVTLDHAERGERYRLRCSGAVVRVEEKGGRVGVAATIASFRLDVVDP